MKIELFRMFEIIKNFRALTRNFEIHEHLTPYNNEVENIIDLVSLRRNFNYNRFGDIMNKTIFEDNGAYLNKAYCFAQKFINERLNLRNTYGLLHEQLKEKLR